MEEHTDFAEEFKRVLNNADIPEVDYYTPEGLEDAYVDMDIALTRDVEGPNFAKVKKCLRDTNSIPIGRDNYNTILDTTVYEVKYLNGHQSQPSENTIA